MSSDSPFFDRIRVKPDQDRRLKQKHPPCEWPGCAGAATHRAPKGRGREKDYWQFCLNHVREYNHSYNFFAGMSTKLRGATTRKVLLATGCIVFAGTAAWIATFPISVSV